MDEIPTNEKPYASLPAAAEFRCDECNRKFTNQQALDHHLGSPIHIPQLPCDACGVQFPTQGALDKHRLSQHANFRCEQCSEAFVDQEALDNHFKSATHIPRHSCDKCSDHFPTQKALDKHSSSQHGEFRCDECDKNFANEVALNYHLESPRHIPQLPCDACGDQFPTKKALDKHRLAKHINLQCKQCKVDFADQETLNNHLKSPVHTPKYSCDKCGDHFTTPEDLEKHRSSQHGKFRCEQHNQSFPNENALKSHLNSSAHLPENHCAECGSKFPSQGALEKHRLSKHDKFRCQEHDKTFASQEALNNHLGSAVHKPKYCCDKCPQQFSTSEALDQHASLHAVKFRCEKHNEDFVDQDALNNHLKSPAHMPEHRCAECGNRFSDQEALDKHHLSKHVKPQLQEHKIPTNQKTPDSHPKPSIKAPNHRCTDCGNCFGSQKVLDKHRSTRHGTFRCKQCSRGFVNQNALDSHLRSAKHIGRARASCECNQTLDLHALSACLKKLYCKKCDKKFVNLYALHQHLVSPAHWLAPCCDKCEGGFGRRRSESG